MVLNAEELTKRALELPVESRARLAEQLVASLADAAPDEISKLWAKEAIARRDEVRSGEVKPIHGEQVLAEARRMAGR